MLLHYILGGADFINDFALNRFEPYGDGARLAGAALFRDGKYTGVNLNDDETQLANLMDGARSKVQVFIGKIGGKSYSALLQNANRDFHIIRNENSLREIEISLKLDVKLIAEEFVIKDHSKKIFTELEKKIAADITEKASKVISTLQKANCDYLQLGHEVAAYHPKLFKGMNWREEYPKINIKPQVKVKILNTGILE